MASAKRRAFWVCGGALVAGGITAALVWGDFARYRSDPDRLQRLAAATLPAAPTAGGADWPQWRGPNRDGVSPETGLRDIWPSDGPPLLWRRPVGRGFSSFAVAGGRLYTMDQDGGDECVVCLDAGTGQEGWRFRYPGLYEERFGPGPRSTPALDGGHVYAVGPTGVFHCLNAATGAKVWRRDLADELGGRAMRYGVSFSPLVEGGLVYAAPGGPDGNSVAAFDKLTGAVAWKALDDPASYSSPVAISAAGTRQILFLTSTELVSFSPDGKRLYWRHPWKPDTGFNIATPLVFGDYVLLSTGYGKGCTLLEVTAGPDGAPRVGYVYEHNRFRPYFATGVRLGDHVYGFDQMDLVCMEVRTGEVVWREKGHRTFKKAALLGADGHLILVGESGTLTLIEATPAGYREKATCRVSELRFWTAPALAGGRLYLRDDAEILCFDLRK